jgi:hypothetical protein
VWVAARDQTNTQRETRTVAAIWFGRNDSRNSSFTIGDANASRQRGEAMALAEALRTAPQDQPLRIICQNRQMVENMTTKLKSRENKGWIMTKHGDILRKAAAWAKKRRARTYFKVAKIAKADRPESEIHEMMQHHLEDNSHTLTKTENAEGYKIEGARLDDLSQADLYRHIVERKRKDPGR